MYTIPIIYLTKKYYYYLHLKTNYHLFIVVLSSELSILNYTNISFILYNTFLPVFYIILFHFSNVLL